VLTERGTDMTSALRVHLNTSPKAHRITKYGRKEMLKAILKAYTINSIAHSKLHNLCS